MLACLLAQALAAYAEQPLPLCNSSGRDIGNGFRLTQYLFDGAPEFSLDFDLPASAVHAADVTIAAQPIHLTFYNLDGPGERHIGYANLDARERDGSAFEPSMLVLDCGGGTHLTAIYGGHFPAHRPPGPSSFLTAFYAERAQVPTCLAALEESGRFTFSFARAQGSPPSLVLSGALPLRQAMVEARRIREDALARGRSGLCRIPPAPPPPF